MIAMIIATAAPTTVMIHALDGGTDNDYFDLTAPYGGPGKQLRAAVVFLKLRLTDQQAIP